MHRTYTGLAALLVAAVVVQISLAAAAAVDPAPTEEAFGLHHVVGLAILVAAIGLTGLAAALRAPRGVVARSALLAGLCVLQPVVATASESFGDGDVVGRVVFGLHGIFAAGILALSAALLRGGRARTAAAAAGEGPAGAAVDRGAHPTDACPRDQRYR